MRLEFRRVKSVKFAAKIKPQLEQPIALVLEVRRVKCLFLPTTSMMNPT